MGLLYLFTELQVLWGLHQLPLLGQFNTPGDWDELQNISSLGYQIPEGVLFHVYTV